MTGRKITIYGWRSPGGWWWRWECPCCKVGDWKTPFWPDNPGQVRTASEIAMWAATLHLIEAGHVRAGRPS